MKHRRQEPDQIVPLLYDSWAKADFAEMLRRAGTLDDAVLSDLIAADGRWRIARAQPVDLGVYLREVPDLQSRRLSIDAAVEVVLKSLIRRGQSVESAVRDLLNAYPALSEPITTAAMLNTVMLSTATARRAAGLGGPPARTLPMGLGPVVDGSPRYELRERLGAGAEGEVYLGVDTLLSEPDRPAYVAVKLQHAPRPEADPDAGARQRAVLDEVTMARRVVHPGVVRVLDAGVTGAGEPYAVYEHVRGRTLRQSVDASPRLTPPRRAAAIALELARGLQAIHSAGLVHCDLQPGNVILDDAGRAKIADFGLALRFERAVSPNAGSGGDDTSPPPRGALGFMSPEQFAQEPGWTVPAADIYALGGLLAWMVTGAVPNGQTGPEAVAALAGPLEGPPPGVSAGAAVAGRADADLGAIVARAMDAKPRLRYASADALAADLEAWLAYEPLRWTATPPLRRATLLAKRQPAALAAVLLALCVAAVVPVALAKARFDRDRERQAADAETARQRSALAEEKLLSARNAIGAFMETFKRGRSESVVRGYLPLVTMIESALGPIVFAAGPEGRSMWEDRYAIAQREAETAERAGGPRSLEALGWRFLQGLWLAQIGRLDEADALLGANLLAWEAVVPAGDPWLDRIRGVRHAVRLLNIPATEREASPAAAESRRIVEAALARVRDAGSLLDASTTLMQQALTPPPTPSIPPAPAPDANRSAPTPSTRPEP